MPPPDPLPADLLLTHSAFLMALARSLVVDEQRAEDVVQETYLAALRKPPPPHVRLRSWLGAVARNLALRSRRTEGRLKRREGGAPPRGSTPPVDDIAARLEVQRRIAEAVSKLAEPGRSAIVHRYFDGLTPAEIARNEGVSVRTIESRLRRARETLRARLDAAYGGSRMTWCAILAPSLGLTLDAIPGAAGGATAGTASATASVAPAASTAAAGAALTGVALMSTKLVVAITVICAAGGFFAGRHLAPAPTDLDGGGGTTVEGGTGTTAGLGADSTMRENALRELKAEREKTAQLAQELARLKAKYGALPSAGADATDPPAVAVAAAKPRFAYESIGEALDGKDWPKIGEAITHLLPLIVKLKRALLEEAPMPENVGDIQRWNGELVNLAVSLDRTDLTGTGMNGAFTHPAVVVNLVHAALSHAGAPLSERQQERLAAVGDRYVTDEARRSVSYGPDAFQLQKTIDETALKDRFYAEVDALLTQAQRDVLHPAEIKGRLGVDIFSSGVIWYVVSKAVPFTDRADLAADLVRQVREIPGYEAQYATIVQDAATEWANGFSDEFLESTDDPLIRVSNRMNAGVVAGWATISQAHTAARHQLVFNRRVAERLPPDSRMAELLRESPRLMIPVKSPTEETSPR